jgi:cytidine deaminase
MATFSRIPEAQALTGMAVAAAEHSYSPYSHFRVGAVAIWQLEAGDVAVTTGCNVENAFYEAAHAESTALIVGVSQGYRHLIGVYVACIDIDADAPLELAMPCGFCRQWLSEFVPDGSDAEVVIVSATGDIRARFGLLRDLLPYPFRLTASRSRSAVPPSA